MISKSAILNSLTTKGAHMRRFYNKGGLVDKKRCRGRLRLRHMAKVLFGKSVGRIASVHVDVDKWV
jgi:hypothetical protein